MLRVLSWVLVAGGLNGCSRPETKCDDGADNDGDSFVDCGDQDCAASCGEVCDNLVDDNGDGNVDCLDPLCGGVCGTSPGAEDCGNGVDDDNDWQLDCDDHDCALLCDGDADGWIDSAYGGLDCEDDEPAVFPGATEAAYNGLDDDCDPTTPDDDLDGDGFLLADDCAGKADDDDATFPGAPETCGDAIPNDCFDEGSLPDEGYCYGDRPALTADGIALGPSPSGLAGHSVALVGDTNGDGYGDLVVGSHGDGDNFIGAAYLVYGPLSGELDLGAADHKWVGETQQGWAGYAVAGGADLVAPGALTDGKPDIVIGMPNADQSGQDSGAVFVVPPFGPTPTELLVVDRKLLGEGDYASAGWATAPSEDIDGDGFDDLIIGSPGDSRGVAGAGAVHVVRGPVLGTVALDGVTARIGGGTAGDGIGCAVASPGDVSGDGLADVLVGACGAQGDAGAVALFTVYTESERALSDADALLAGAADEALGTALAGGDLDGDGVNDLVLGAPGANDGAGVAYVSFDGLGAADAALHGESAGDLAGTSVSVAGDVDDDGAADVLVGAPGSDLGGPDSGAAYLAFGPFSGAYDLGEADVRVIGAASFDLTGQSVSGGSDVDDDGLPDILVGAPFHDGLNPAAGAAYLFTFDW